MAAADDDDDERARAKRQKTSEAVVDLTGEEGEEVKVVRSPTPAAEMKTRELKQFLLSKGVDLSGCIERKDLVERADALARCTIRKNSSIAPPPPSSSSSSSSRPPFRLLSLGCLQNGVPAKGTVRLQDLVCGNFRSALVSNYLLDISWFVSTFPSLARCKELIVVHGQGGHPGANENIKRALIQARGTQQGHLLVHAPPLPIAYGTHHSKFLILIDHSKLRLIIHTANLIAKDFLSKTQGIWWQDFKLKTSSSLKSCAFESDLLQYLHSLKLAGSVAENFLKNISKVDFSDARALGLVASVPGYHRNDEMNHYGHMKLRTLLSEQNFDECFRGSPLVYQFSSLGSLDEKWLYQEFTQSASSGDTTNVHNEPVRLGKPKDLEKDLHLVWPTVMEVRDSLEGWGAGDSIPGYQKNVSKKFLRKHFRKWVGRFGLKRAMPHIKTFCRYAKSAEAEGTRFAWICMGSHNLSKAAWGCLQKKETQLMVRSYELSVLLAPQAPSTFTLMSEGAGGRERENETPIPIPFAFPPRPYDSQDTPWMVDVPYPGPDNFGNLRVTW